MFYVCVSLGFGNGYGCLFLVIELIQNKLYLRISPNAQNLLICSITILFVIYRGSYQIPFHLVVI